VRQTFPAVAGDYRCSILPVLVILVLFGAGAYLSAGYVVSNDIYGLAYIALISLGVVFAVAIINNWRTGVYFFLAWLLFEYLARKYLGNNPWARNTSRNFFRNPRRGELDWKAVLAR
jgi:hypothetical protein